MKPHDFKLNDSNTLAVCRLCKWTINITRPDLPFHGGGACAKRPELGDVVANVIHAAGYRPKRKCGGCGKRQNALNQIQRGVEGLVGRGS